MSKTFISNENIESSASQLARSLGLPASSAQKAIKKFETRVVSDDEKIFGFTAKGKYIPLKAGTGLLSAVDVARITGLRLDQTKSFLQQPYGFHTQDGIYGCVIKSKWTFKENE